MMIEPAPASAWSPAPLAAWRRGAARHAAPQRGVGSRGAREQVGDLLAHRHAGDAQLAALAVVALHEHAHRVAARRGGHAARRGADAALEAVADHPRAAAHVPLAHRPARGRVERGDGVLRPHVEAVDVVQRPVVRLRDHRQPPRLEPGAAHLPPEHRVPHDAHAVRVRDRDRPLEDARLLQPGRPGHLAVAVEREPGAEHGVRAPLPAREHGGHAGAHRPAADHQPAAPADERRVPHLDAGHVGDRVERAGRAPDQRADAELARPRLGRAGRLRRAGATEERGRAGGDEEAGDRSGRAHSLHSPPYVSGRRSR
jgi:hypothetical protein